MNNTYFNILLFQTAFDQFTPLSLLDNQEIFPDLQQSAQRKRLRNILGPCLQLNNKSVKHYSYFHVY